MAPILPPKHLGQRSGVSVVITDLDGALLDAGAQGTRHADSGLEMLRLRGIPLVFCTSKTRAEIEFWRARLSNSHPFIAENGGAVYLPRGYFPFAIPSAAIRGDYDVVQFGSPLSALIETLAEASDKSGIRVRAFHHMNVREISASTGLPIEQAELASLREYDEPFEIPGPRHRPLLKAIEKRGMRWTRGGRFYHITGGHDKSTAVQFLCGLYRRAWGEAVIAGLGDAPNDIGFLCSVDIPVVVRSAHASEVRRAAPHSRVTRARGAAGWNEAVLRLLAS